MSDRTQKAVLALEGMGFVPLWRGTGPDKIIVRSVVHRPTGVVALVLDYGEDGYDIFLPAHEGNSIDDTFAAVKRRIQEVQDG